MDTIHFFKIVYIREKTMPLMAEPSVEIDNPKVKTKGARPRLVWIKKGISVMIMKKTATIRKDTIDNQKTRGGIDPFLLDKSLEFDAEGGSGMKTIENMRTKRAIP